MKNLVYFGCIFRLTNMKVKEESEKVGLKLNIQETKIMASSPITSWKIDREKMEMVTDFIFLGSKIIADGDCSMPGFPVSPTPRNLLKLMSTELVMPSNHLILCHPLFLLPSIFSRIRVFPMNWLFASGGQSTGVSALASFLPKKSQG